MPLFTFYFLPSFVPVNQHNLFAVTKFIFVQRGIGLSNLYRRLQKNY